MIGYGKGKLFWNCRRFEFRMRNFLLQEREIQMKTNSSQLLRSITLLWIFPLLIFLVQSEERREFQNNFPFPYPIIYNPGVYYMCKLQFFRKFSATFRHDSWYVKIAEHKVFFLVDFFWCFVGFCVNSRKYLLLLLRYFEKLETLLQLWQHIYTHTTLQK